MFGDATATPSGVHFADVDTVTDVTDASTANDRQRWFTRATATPAFVSSPEIPPHRPTRRRGTPTPRLSNGNDEPLHTPTRGDRSRSPTKERNNNSHTDAANATPDDQCHGSNWFLPKGFETLSAVTWNADALIQAPATTSPYAAAKERTLHKLLDKHLIVIVQETHGNPAQWDAWKNKFRKRAAIYTTIDEENPRIGGVAIFVNVKLASLCAYPPRATTVIAARALEVELIFPNSKVTVTGIHNAKIHVHEKRRLVERCRRITATAQCDPYASDIHIVGGDFNFRKGDSPIYRISHDHMTLRSIADTPDAADKAEQKIWAPYTRIAMQHYVSDPTRIGTTTNAQGGNYTFASSIDRVYSSLTGWRTPQLEMTANVMYPVTRARKQCGSDHVPTSLRISQRSQRPKSERPIPKWVADHPAYKEILTHKLEALDLDEDTDPFFALRLIKQEMRASGKEAIRKIMKEDPDSPETRMQRVLQISRAIAYHDTGLARIVQKASPDLGQCYAIASDGTIVINNTTRFNELTAKYAKDFHDQEIQSNAEGPPRKGKTTRDNHLKRLNDQWSPFGRKSVTVNITKADGTPTDTPEEAGEELTRHWGQTFSAKTIDATLARAILRSAANKLDLSDTTYPSEEAFVHFLRRTKHSAPGPDGLPYVVWKAAGLYGAKWLRRALIAMCEGRSPPAGFNDNISVFPPKGTQAEDTDIAVSRLPEDTRPLGCKNCDNKTIAGTVNHLLAPHVAAWANKSQNGFTKGRQGLDNIVSLDGASRIAAMLAGPLNNYNIGALPIMCFYDFAAAFPSVAHRLIFLTLRAIGFPRGLLNYFKALYAANKCFTRLKGKTVYLYLLASGIIQGCPLSGTVFVIVVDTFLNLLGYQSPQTMIKAFADDIGALLQQLNHLASLQKAFDAFGRISGLHLKPQKCVIVIISHPLTEHLKANVKRYLLDHIPQWKDFTITDKATYLGMIMGPKGGGLASWRNPMAKYYSRAVDIYKAGAPPRANIHLYKTFDTPVTGYVAQLAPLPKEYNKTELHALQKVMHLVHNALPKDTFHQLSEIGLPDIPPLRDTCDAARARTALLTCSVWEDAYAQISHYRSEYMPPLGSRSQIKDWHRNTPEWWGTPSYADHLKDATRASARHWG